MVDTGLGGSWSSRSSRSLGFRSLEGRAVINRWGWCPRSPRLSRGSNVQQRHWLCNEGDVVEVTGQVIVTPSGGAMYCPPRPTNEDPEVPPVKPGETPSMVTRNCRQLPESLKITLHGVDGDQLGSSEMIEGTRVGYATLRGNWRGQSIDVTEQTVPASPSPAPVDDIPVLHLAVGGRSAASTDRANSML